jgi:hypothetical protein
VTAAGVIVAEVTVAREIAAQAIASDAAVSKALQNAHAVQGNFLPTVACAVL